MIGIRDLRAARFWLLAFCVHLVLAACSGAASNEPAVEAAPETAVETEPQATPEMVTEPTAVEVAVETVVDPLEIGDPALGEELFNDHNRIRCSGCHTVDGGTHRSGPTLLGISQVAGERVDGLSAAEYVRQSILDPEAYLLEGFEESEKPMPVFEIAEKSDGPMRLATVTEEELNDLIAYVLTH